MMRARLLLEDGTLFEGAVLRRRRRGRRGGRLQYRDDRVPGGADRPLLLRTDCRHDIPVDRKLSASNRRRGRGVPSPFDPRFRRPGPYTEFPSYWRNEKDPVWVAEGTRNSVGIAGIDTRMLTRKIRRHRAR